MSFILNGTLTLLGAGKMGSALLSGWVSAGVDANKIQIIDPSPCSKAEELVSTHHLALNPESNPTDILVVAVKPQIMEATLSGIQGYLKKDSLVISIAAGQKLASLENMLPENCAVIRTMPNTPAEIGKGITVACANEQVSSQQKEQCDYLLQCVGQVGWVEDESLMDAVTAVSGSGPAYIFHFTECLIQAGIEAGLEKSLAQELARATVAGAGALMQQTGIDAAQLRENVTSPGGTTAAALEVLMSPEGLGSLISKAVKAAQKRSIELSS